MMGEGIPILVRNPYLPDLNYRTSVPPGTTVRGLKEKLFESYDGHPEVDDQRLIAGGKVSSLSW